MPATMCVPALLLVLLAIAIGLIPHLDQQVRAAASTMADRAGYQSRVLDNSHLLNLEPAKESTSLTISLLRSFATAAAAVLLALFTLSPKWPSRKKQPYTVPLRGPLYALRAIHTGHVGDYVAFLTFGVAAVGLALALLIRVFNF